MNGRIPSLGSRLKGRVIDGLAFAVITGALVLSGQVIKCCGRTDSIPPFFYAELLPIPAGIPGNGYFYVAHALFWWLLIVGLIPSLLVEVPMVALNGGTLGKIMAGSKVIRVSDGGKPGWSRSFIRWLVLYGLIAVPILGWSILLLNIARLRRDPEHRGIHDRLAGTMVLKAPPATGGASQMAQLAPAVADRRSLAGWRSLASMILLGSCTTSVEVYSAEVSRDDLRLRLTLQTCKPSSVSATVKDVVSHIEVAATASPARLLGGPDCQHLVIVALPEPLAGRDVFDISTRRAVPVSQSSWWPYDRERFTMADYETALAAMVACLEARDPEMQAAIVDDLDWPTYEWHKERDERGNMSAPAVGEWASEHLEPLRVAPADNR